MNTIRHNDSSDTVRIAQLLTGYSNTGTYDANYVAFMCSWQSAHNLTPDGIIGANTWAAIAKDAPTVSKSKNSKSSAAKAVQLIVGADADGIFGSKTKSAVAAWQSANGLTADGVVGQNTWSAMLTGTAAGKVLNNCVHYLQWDSRWKKVKYSTHTSSQTIGNSGCGTTSMAMILATWIDKSITPVETSKLSVDNGYRTYSSGTSWSFYEFCFKHYSGFSKFIKTGSIETLQSALRQGALAVCSMNNKDGHFWTSAGHFITAIGCDDKYIYANDPNKKTCPRKQEIAKFKQCMKQAFIFWN